MKWQKDNGIVAASKDAGLAAWVGAVAADTVNLASGRASAPGAS